MDDERVVVVVNIHRWRRIAADDGFARTGIHQGETVVRAHQEPAKSAFDHSVWAEHLMLFLPCQGFGIRQRLRRG